VIKYDSSFRSGDQECFVLEHVEHDRPEVWHFQLAVMLFFLYQLSMFVHFLLKYFCLPDSEKGNRHVSVAVVWVLSIQSFGKLT
jgi:hypothetical protein